MKESIVIYSKICNQADTVYIDHYLKSFIHKYYPGSCDDEEVETQILICRCLEREMSKISLLQAN